MDLLQPTLPLVDVAVSLGCAVPHQVLDAAALVDVTRYRVLEAERDWR